MILFFLSAKLTLLSIPITFNSDKGKFNAVSGQTCFECMAGFFQEQNTNPSLSCNACPAGYDSTLNGSSSCSDLGGIKPSDCKDNKYFNVTDCVDCPPGGSCVGDINASGIRTMFGWSRCPNLNLKFEPCAYQPACLGASNPALTGKFSDLALADNESLCADGYQKNAHLKANHGANAL